jgi:hypothetical protein
MEEFTSDQCKAIIGAPSDPSGFTIVVRGSQRYSCNACHGNTWISPESVKAIKKNRELKVYCMTCMKAGKVRDREGNSPKAGRPPREVLAADLGDEIADMIIRDDRDPTKD